MLMLLLERRNLKLDGEEYGDELEGVGGGERIKPNISRNYEILKEQTNHCFEKV